MSRRLAWSVWALCVAIALPTVVLLALGAGASTPADGFGLTGAGGLAFVVAALAFATTGALVASKVPSNASGWIFCLVGLAIAAGNLPYQYADYALYVAPGSLPGGETAAVLQNLGLPPAFGLLALSLLLFPDGHLLSRRWLPAAAAALSGSAAVAVGYGLRPGALDYPFDSISNPFGVGSFALMEALGGLGWMLSAVSVALAAVAMVVRLRRSQGQERQQLKWIGLAGVVAGVVLVGTMISFTLEVQGIDEVRLPVVGLAFVGIPVAAGIAILRYRLYDIDLIIRRTLVYGALIGILGALYIGLVLGLQTVLSGLTGGETLPVALSTLVIAALFGPLRARFHAIVDRRFYRSRYDAQRTLATFASRLRDEIDQASLSSELLDATRAAVQPSSASVWLRGRAP